MSEKNGFATDQIFEGMISVRALINAAKAGLHDRKIIRLWYSREKAEKDAKELAWLGHRAQELGFGIELVSREQLDGVAVGTTHGGVVAFASERTIPTLTREDITGGGFYVMLDGVEDPYNFGYAIRSLYAMGVKGIVLSPRNRMNAGGIVCRASAGASEQIPMYIASAEDAAALFRTAGYRVIAADLRESESCDTADLSFPLFLLVGGEKRGISRRVLDTVDARIRIDYARSFDQSLSAASATTILAYEVFRQNRIGSDQTREKK
jgi:23S rRNA (guanosine2251-2'-O)-methyltransferase